MSSSDPFRRGFDAGYKWGLKAKDPDPKKAKITGGVDYRAGAKAGILTARTERGLWDTAPDWEHKI